MTRTMPEAFNEWMRRFIEEPDRFEREWRTVSEFIKAESEGKEPDYGQSCERYLNGLLAGE